MTNLRVRVRHDIYPMINIYNLYSILKLTLWLLEGGELGNHSFHAPNYLDLHH